MEARSTGLSRTDRRVDYLPRQRRFFGRDDVKKSGAIGPGGGGGDTEASGTGRGPDATGDAVGGESAEPSAATRGTDVDASSDPRESMSFAILTDDSKSLTVDVCVGVDGDGGAGLAKGGAE